MIDEEERERRRAYIEDMREMLKRLDDEDACAARSFMAEPESRYSPEPRLTQSFCDMPLLSSEPMERCWAKAEAFQRERERATAIRKAEEAEIIRERQRAAEREARLDMTEQLTEVLGEVIAMEREFMRAHVAEQLGLLRAELTVQRAAERAHERGQILDLPALPLRRRGNAA